MDQLSIQTNLTQPQHRCKSLTTRLVSDCPFPAIQLLTLLFIGSSIGEATSAPSIDTNHSIPQVHGGNAPPSIPSCISATTEDGLGNLWQEIYVGAGFTENPNNPNNVGFAPLIIDFESGPIQSLALQACTVLQECILWTHEWNNLLSIDLHLITAPSQEAGIGYWECVGYPNRVGGTLGGSNYFNVSNTAVSVAYGYDIVGASSTTCPTLAPPVAALNCGTPWSSGGSDSWTQQYFGSCFTANVGNTFVLMESPVALTLVNLDVGCTFLSTCLKFAIDSSTSITYQNVAAYLVAQTSQPGYSQWVCTAYFNLAPSGTNFTNYNSSILMASEYFLPPTLPNCPSSISIGGESATWYQLFNGSGFSESSSRSLGQTLPGPYQLMSWTESSTTTNLGLACT